MDNEAVDIVPGEHHDATTKGDSEAQVAAVERVSSKRQRLSDVFTIVSPRFLDLSQPGTNGRGYLSVPMPACPYSTNGC